ncbi:MAG: glycosyltransferase family 4 protein [Dehalococcoidia bacterium]
MKIVHVRDVAHTSSTLVEGLNTLGHQAEVLPATTGRHQYRLRYAKVLSLPRRALELRRVNRYIRQRGFDVVHIHLASLGWLGIVGRYPYFLHCHGYDIWSHLRRPMLRRLTLWGLRRAERVFYATPDLAADTQQVRSDAAFFPIPVDTERFRPLAGLGHEGPPRVLLISRIWDIKGVDVAFAIIARFKRRRPEVLVDALAAGPHLRLYRGNTYVNFLPRVPYEEMPTFINRYDVVIGQFRLGIMSTSELESMACGKPVVSYFSYPQFYDEPPPLYSTNDVEMAAEYLTALVGDPALRRQAGEQGREWVLRHHNYLDAARTLEAEYAAMAGP